MANRTFSSVASFLAAKSTLVGDSGSDTLSFAAATSQITLSDSLFGGMSSMNGGATAKLENLVLASTAANNDTLGTTAQSIGFSSIFGGTAADSINLSSFTSAVTINGGTGNDNVWGGAGNDSLLGGTGNDSINGGAGHDTVVGDSGADTLLGGTGDDSLDGGADNDSLVGGSGSNTLIGGMGNDTLSSTSSSDSLIGGDGNDYYSVSSTSGANIYELASGGTDSVSTVVEDYTLGSNLDVLILNAGVIEGTGSATANTLVGNASNNSLFGAAGND